MGDIQTDQGEALELQFVPVDEFNRLLDANVSDVARARAFAALARINTLYMIAGAWSGHIGTSFSSLEIMSWVFLNEIRDLAKGPQAADVFFSSKGHDAPALYNVLIGLGLLPDDKLHQLRRLHGLPGHPHVETPYIQANTGSLGMGISKAKGMALANRLAGNERRVFVLTGDGELQEGQFWESLASAANRGLGEIVAIVDHNKIQSDTWVQNVSDLGDIEAKFRAFGWHVVRCDGHDVAALERTFRALDEVENLPKVIIADTVKGKGVSFMEGPAMAEGELYGYHSGAPGEQQYTDGLAELLVTANRLFAELGLGEVKTETRLRNPRREPRKTDNLIAAYEQALLWQGERHRNLVVLDADLVKDCGLVQFSKRYPDRFVECGIAEQDMVSMASGMARRGVLPIVHSFACFLSARPNEQIYNQCTEGTKVIYVGSLAGLIPGGPGHSHQSVRDISALRGVPNLSLLEPCMEAEVGALVEYAVNTAIDSVLSPARVGEVADSLRLSLASQGRDRQGLDRPRWRRCDLLRLRSVADVERVRGRRGDREEHRREHSPGQPAVAESHRPAVAARSGRRPPIDRHARQSLSEGRAGRDGRHGDRRARPRAGRPRVARRA